MPLDNIVILINPKAGKGKALSVGKLIERLLIQNSIPFSTFNNQWPDSFEGYSRIFLVGGDGTLNFFINKYPEAKLPIALFKGGSGNDFAWKIYGDKSVVDYFRDVFNNEAITVDAGVCNGRYFINGVGIGFDAAVVRAMGKRRWVNAGHISYLLTVLATIWRYREKLMKVIGKDIGICEKIFMISVANGSRYGGGFMVAPSANPYDGLFDVVVIKKIAVLKRAYYLPLVEKGKHVKLPFVNTIRTNKITVSADTNLFAHLDGELIESSTFQINIIPSHFKFFA